MKLQRAPRPTILVKWRDGDGIQQSVVRKVHFLPGFGHYVRWNKRYILVNPEDKELLV